LHHVRVGVRDVVLHDYIYATTTATVVRGSNHRAEVTAVKQHSNACETKSQEIYNSAARIIQITSVTTAWAEKKKTTASCAMILHVGGISWGEEGGEEGGEEDRGKSLTLTHASR